MSATPFLVPLAAASHLCGDRLHLPRGVVPTFGLVFGNISFEAVEPNAYRHLTLLKHTHSYLTLFCFVSPSSSTPPHFYQPALSSYFVRDTQRGVVAAMSPFSSSCLLLTNSPLSPSSSPLISHSPSQSACPSTSLVMKDVSNTSRASSRPSAYPKKRPSPYGVSKSRKQSPLYPPHPLVRKSPRATRAEILAQRQREAQLQALRR